MSEASEIVRGLIAKMILKSNFWGYVFSKLKRREDPTLPSIMGVAPEQDGSISLLYNPHLFKGTSEKIMLLIIHHEGIHLLNKHIPRLLKILRDIENEIEARKHTGIWNIAADFTSNEYVQMPQIVKIGGFDCSLAFPQHYNLPSGATSEWYYQELLKMQNQMSASESSSGSKFRSVSKQKGKDKLEESSNEEGEGKEEQESQGQREDHSFGGSSPSVGNESQVPTSLDSHDSWSKVKNEVSDLSSLAQKLEDFTKTITKEAIKEFNTTRGLLPAGVQELINELFEPPKAPYYEIIKKLIRGSRLTKFQRSFTRINRKRTYAFAIDSSLGIPKISPFPGKKRDYTFNIGLLSDTSGSMTPDMIKDCLSGAKSIIEKDRHCKTTMIEVDAQIQKEYIIKKVSDIDFQVRGRGGTYLFPALERFKELKVDVVLGFTDAACENINSISRKLLPKKIIWVVREGFSVATIDKTGYIVRIPGGYGQRWY